MNLAAKHDSATPASAGEPAAHSCLAAAEQCGSLTIGGASGSTRLHPARNDRSAIFLALIVAVSGHLGLFLAMILDHGWRVGANGTDLNAVSIEVSIVSADALESRATDRDKASGSAGRLDRTDGAPEAKPPAAEAAPAKPETVKAEDKTKPEPTPEEAAPAPAPPRPSPAEQSAETAPAAPVGGQSAIAIANVLPTTQNGAAEASAGELRAYSISVVEALAMSRPHAQPGMAGTVRIVFQITEQGVPTNVRISASSGKPAIDTLVMAAIVATRFLPPPANASIAQRTYELPYVFR